MVVGFVNEEAHREFEIRRFNEEGVIPETPDC